MRRVLLCVAVLLGLCAGWPPPSFGRAGRAVPQEVLRPARIRARALRRQPPTGLPRRLDGQVDPVVWQDSGGWHGADSLDAAPLWSMASAAGPDGRGVPAPVPDLCAAWATERPKAPVDIVWGPHDAGWFVAICKKTRGSLGWKSIAFLIPREGIPASGKIWDYSHSVNWLERRIGYDLFPKLPSHLQEIIEEMSASELLCPVQEFDAAPIDAPDMEVDHDWEDDRREID